MDHSRQRQNSSVVGVVEPAGRRVIACGSTGAAAPLNGDTVFQIGSVSKIFATLLLSQMAGHGEVKLDDAAELYLPKGVTMPTRGRQITLADLATHMSGLPSMPTNFDLTARPNPVEAYSERDLYRFLGAYELSREPGARLAYSNLGMALMGRLLARRLHGSYEEVLGSRVLRPLGLQSTSISLSPDQRRRLAPGHDRYRRPVETWEMRTLAASGSLRSTANDLLTLLEGYLGRSSPLSTAIAFQTSQPKPENSQDQTLGIPKRANASGGVTFFHDGGKEGYRSFIAFNPANRTGVVVLANMRSDDALERLVLHLMNGRPLPESQSSATVLHPPVVSLSPAERSACNGRYQSPEGAILAVACLRDRMLLDAVGEGVEVYYASEKGRFLSRTAPSEVLIAADRLMLKEGARERRFVRLA